MGRKWDLDDLAGAGDLARLLGVSRATFCNWQKRYPDFPKPLVRLAAGPVFSREQVLKWHAQWTWE